MFKNRAISNEGNKLDKICFLFQLNLCHFRFTDYGQIPAAGKNKNRSFKKLTIIPCACVLSINNNLHLVQNILRYLSTDIICSEKRNVFRENGLRITVGLEEQVMSKDKYSI